jgi:hypothetical protein
MERRPLVARGPKADRGAAHLRSGQIILAKIWSDRAPRFPVNTGKEQGTCLLISRRKTASGRPLRVDFARPLYHHLFREVEYGWTSASLLYLFSARVAMRTS